jgi:hypothetical protein
MNVEVLPLASFARKFEDVTFVRDHLTRPGSDFFRALNRWIVAADLPPRHDDEPLIALVRDHGEIVGWARTETWLDGARVQWPTLEAFVSTTHRRRGIAALASMALASARLYSHHVAVFRPLMLTVAARAGLKPTLFVQASDGYWEMVQ